ncbi:MAG: hypothetical protein ABWK53_10690 [Anaerolineales bacterium]
MEVQEFLHKVSVDTNVNIELLKDLYDDTHLWDLIRAGKINDAASYVRSLQPRVRLLEALMVVKAFAKEGK